MTKRMALRPYSNTQRAKIIIQRYKCPRCKGRKTVSKVRMFTKGSIGGRRVWMCCKCGYIDINRKK